MSHSCVTIMALRPEGQITHLQVEPTTRCNLNCTSCIKPVYDREWVEKEISLKGLDCILHRSPGIMSVHLQGWGEPLLHPDLPGMIQVCKKRGLSVSFTSNGSIMNMDLADRLIGSGLDAVTFSMAGGSAATQDAVRGRGSFKNLKRSVEVFLARRSQAAPGYRPKVAISYLLTPRTVHELPWVVRWCRKSGIERLATVHLTQAVHQGQEDLQFFPDPLTPGHKWLRFWSNFLALGKDDFRFSLRPFVPEKLPMCDKDPMTSCYVAADGSVSPCVFLNPPVPQGIQWKKGEKIRFQSPVIFGNLADQDLDVIYNGGEYRAFCRRFQDRVELYGRAMSKVGYSMEGSAQLDQANAKIARGFEVHLPPEPCRFCRKLEGF